MKNPSLVLSSLLLLSLSLFPAEVAQADPAEDLTKILKETAASPTRTLTFFQGLSKLENCDLKGAELKKIFKTSGIKLEGLLGAFLGDLDRLRKKGSEIMMVRPKALTENTSGGLVRVGKEIKFRLSTQGTKGVTLKKLKGTKAGKKGGSMHPVRSLTLTVDKAKITTAVLNVGYGFGFNKNVTVVLAAPTSAGIAGSLPGN
jgi:hypothetical protein